MIKIINRDHLLRRKKVINKTMILTNMKRINTLILEIFLKQI